MSYYDELMKFANDTNYLNWDYYQCHNCLLSNEGDKIDLIFHSPRMFIDDTFSFAQKRKLIYPDVNGCFSDSGISLARSAHSISAFFLGFMLAKGLIGEELDEFCFVDTKQNNFEFTYIWNLVCLYHDFGYMYENNQQKYNAVVSAVLRRGEYYHKIPFMYGLKQFKQNEKISNDIYSRFFKKIRYHLENNELKSISEKYLISEFLHNNIKNVYCNNNNIKIPNKSLKLVSSYFSYRLFGEDFKCIDHGISGGLLFYDLIIKNYIEEYYKCLSRNPNTDISSFEVNNFMGKTLRLDFCMIPIFAYISDCIVNHNIWKASRENESEYIKFGLNKLIGDSFKKVNFKSNPLLFILILSDVLEPYKNYYKSFYYESIDETEYDCNKAINIFKNIDLKVEKNRIAITPNKNCYDDCCTRIKDMKDWIDIDFEFTENECIIYVL